MVKITPKSVTFELDVNANEVILKGSWDNWKGEKMKKNKKGVFSKRKKLKKGIYEFGYMVDGRWMVDDSVELVDSPFGSKNSLLRIER
ncbi:glycogen-binding domain-containing protein [Caminibacter sp.]